MKRTFLAAVVALCVSVTAVADDKPGDGKPGAKPGAGKRPGKPGDGTPGAGRGALMAQLFKRADTNNDGKVTLEEFKAVAEKAPGGRLKDVADKVFARMDTDGDGVLSAEEIKNAGQNFPGRPGKPGEGKPGERKPGAKKPDDK